MIQRDTAHGKFDLPDDWKDTTVYNFIKVEQALSTPRFAGRGVTTQPTRAAITISQLEATKETLADALARQLAGVASQLPDLEVVKFDEHGELVGYEIRFSGPDERKLRQRSEHLPWKSGHKFTVVTLTATDDTFDRFRGELTAVVASFKSPDSEEIAKPEQPA